MSQLCDPFNVLRPFRDGRIFSLPALEESGAGRVSRLPVCLRVMLESVLRHCGGGHASDEDVRNLAAWNPSKAAAGEIPFIVARILLQDFTGVPLLVDLAAMRDAVQALGGDPKKVEPLAPADLVIDHSVQTDFAGTPEAFAKNLEREFERNRERYEFLKWGEQAFQSLRIIPPAAGIIHQVNLEHLARLVLDKEVDGEKIYYPDTVAGTDSHTTTINGVGVAGWGVGGIEAEAGMLGQPIYIPVPEVAGVRLEGRLRAGVTATDAVLCLTELLRKENVVGQFVEYHGEGAAALGAAARATIANMAPEYGATMGFFPVDEKTIEYMELTGRPPELIELIKEYYEAQGMFGMPRAREADYSRVIEFDLASVKPSAAGPRRPQDRIDLPEMKKAFRELLGKSAAEGGFDIPDQERESVFPVKGCKEGGLRHGSVVIASITSCTNTSNPEVMMAAGLLARKAAARGLRVPPTVKTSLAPGSRAVSDYLQAAGVQASLDQLGFHLAGYGCMTCIGNSGPLDPAVESAVKEHSVVAAAVLSGNRNFEARIHPSARANYLMSPPLVVAFALAGRVDIDFETEPVGKDTQGRPVFLRELWPAPGEIQESLVQGIKPDQFTRAREEKDREVKLWEQVRSLSGPLYPWREESTYIQRPPFFEGAGLEPPLFRPLREMRLLALLGDSVTTDHISPAGPVSEDGNAGRYLTAKGVKPADFNSFGSRRGNDRVMTRGAFANVRLKNRLAGGREGGWTKLQPDGRLMPIYDACQTYRERGTPLLVVAGRDYGMGSSRDWAAKGAFLLGVKAVLAESYERIHRGNLAGMGVLPLQFTEGTQPEDLNLDGSEIFSLRGMETFPRPRQEAELEIRRADGTTRTVSVLCRLDTPVEADYYRHGGILPFVLRQILSATV